MSLPRPMRAIRRAMTLTELLVVVAIIVILAGMIVPMMQPVLRGQKVREATRQINTFFAGAQSRATERGKPVGVWIERAAHENGAAMNLWFTAQKMYLAEQPDSYTGDMPDARMTIVKQPTDPPTVWTGFFDPPSPYLPHCCEFFSSPNSPLYWQRGDRIRFEANGPDFLILGVDNNMLRFQVEPQFAPIIARYVFQAPTPPPTNLADWQMYPMSVPFEILRRPVRVAVNTLELPRNTAVDLSLSGYQSRDAVTYLPSLTRFRDASIANDPRYMPIGLGSYPEAGSPEYDIVVMFRPGGGVDRVHYISHEPVLWPWSEKPMSPISLFVVREDQIARSADPNNPTLNLVGTPTNQNAMSTFAATSLGEANLQDADNQWLTIDMQTGRVATAPNVNPFAQMSLPLPLAPNVDIRQYISIARQLADTGLDQGGR